MTRIADYSPFIGYHCETNTSGNLLKHAGLEMSEPMLFGLGEGLAFGVFAFKNMPAPFIGGRTKGEEITKALARNLGFEVEYRTTRSKKRAWENVAAFIDAGQPVGVKLDMYFLDYFTEDIHFAAHYVAAIGYDDDQVYLIDTHRQGRVLSTSRKTFEQARLWKGPMASNALTWTITPGDEVDLPATLRTAIVSNAIAYLNPPISNFGAKGMRKAARLVPNWLDTVEDAPAALAQIGMLMEHGGTGGALFRNFYRDFLTEANDYLDSPAVLAARDNFAQAAPLWTEVANNFIRAGREGRDRLIEAAELLRRLTDLEEEAVARLAAL